MDYLWEQKFPDRYTNIEIVIVFTYFDEEEC